MLIANVQQVYIAGVQGLHKEHPPRAILNLPGMREKNGLYCSDL